jgi:hypothetical protein
MHRTIISHQALTICQVEINQNLVEELGIIMHFNDHTGTWDTDTLPIKHRDIEIYHQ